MEKKDLASLLHCFYVEVGTNDEKNYSTQGLVTLRSGLCHYLQGDPFNCIIDLTKDSEFLQANRILKGKQRIKRDDGEDRKQSKKWVKKKDLEKNVRICNSKFG